MTGFIMKLFTYISILIWLGLPANIPKNYLKTIDKEIQLLFDVSSFEKIPVVPEPDVLAKMTKGFNPEGLYRIAKDNSDLGYFYYAKAPSKTDEFDFVVIFDDDFIIKKIRILAYREDYGGEISSKRWLRQFDGLQTGTSVDYGKEVRGISGATISARSMTVAVNELLSNLTLIQQ